MGDSLRYKDWFEKAAHDLRGAEILMEHDGGTQVIVVDQGPGIDEAHRQSITEPFRRLDQRYGGSGLGLSIVQRIVQLHHGKLTLENGIEGGLIASCWLPATLS